MNGTTTAPTPEAMSDENPPSPQTPRPHPHAKVSYAIAYARKGMPVFPLHNIESDGGCSCGKTKCESAGKHPRLKDWQRLATRDEKQIAEWWSGAWENANIGIACGTGSNLTVLDVDGDEGRDTLRALELEHGELPETPIAITGSGGAHYYFLFEEGVGNAVRFAQGLDIRTEGGLIVGVGSATKRPYAWEAAFTFGDLQPARMPQWLSDLIKAAGSNGKSGGSTFRVDEEIKSGERNDTLWRLARSLKAKGLSAEAIRAALQAENGAKCRPPLSPSEVDQIAHNAWTEQDRADFADKAKPEPEWSDPISLDIPASPALPSGIFPAWSESFIDALADATETPRELAAMMELGVIATATQRKFVIQVQRGYSEPLNLWALPVLPSGTRKTQVLHASTRALRQWEKERLAELAPRIAEAQSQRETALARIGVLRAKAARADDSADYAELQRQIEGLESALPKVLNPPRKWVQDITVEKLGVLLADNGEAMSGISDEGGLFDILAGRYSNGVPNLDLVLQAHAGAPVRVDRGSRESVMLDSPALTLILSPQPDVLQGLASKPGFRGRGLLARLLLVLPVSRVGYRTGNTKPVPETVSNDRDAHIRALLNFERPESGPHTILLSDEAYAEWREFSAQVEISMREGGRLESIQDWGSKLPGAAARIAGNLHVAEHAFGSPATSKLSLDTMKKALSFAAVLIPHALASFDLMGADEALKGARRVWGWIQRERKPQFNFRDLFNAVRGTFPRTADLEAPIGVLIERNHVALLESPKQAGRPSRFYSVNPKLVEAWK